jgi:hypothetical protein
MYVFLTSLFLAPPPPYSYILLDFIALIFKGTASVV